MKTVAIVDDSTAYGQGLAVEFEKQAKANGITVLSHGREHRQGRRFPRDSHEDQGEKPDAIMYGGLDGTGGPFAKQAKQLGIAVKVLAGDGLCADDLAKLAGDAADNVICSIAGAPLLKMADGPAFVERYKKRFGYAPVLILRLPTTRWA